MYKGVTYTKMSKGRLREGQPMSMRNTKPTGKRPYDVETNIANRPAYKYLIKAMQDLGGKEASTNDLLNDKYYKRDMEEVAELWNFATSDLNTRIQILGEGLHGTVKILRNGKVAINLELDFGHTMPYSVSRIFNECGFDLGIKDDNVYTKQYRQRAKNGWEVGDVDKEAPLNSIDMEVPMEAAAKMFNKLAKKLAKANPSYDETSSYKTPEDYFRAKGEIAGAVTVKFSIFRETDGSDYVTGTLLKNVDDYWTANISDSYNADDDGEYCETLRSACENICHIFDNIAGDYDSYFDPSKALRSLPRSLSYTDLDEAKNAISTLVAALNTEIDFSNDQLDPDDDDVEGYWDHIDIQWEAPEEDKALMNDNRKKRLAKMDKQKAYDDAHRYESIMRKVKALKESSVWNKETNPIAKAAFDAVFAVLDANYIDINDLDFDYDDEMEEEYAAENNEMCKNALQGIYHALEQFIPMVSDVFGPEGMDIVFGDEVYAIAAN